MSNQQLLSDLARVKALFQLRTIEMIIQGGMDRPKEPTMTLTDEQALELGRELYCLTIGEEASEDGDEIDLCISLGRIAFKRSMELAKEMEK